MSGHCLQVLIGLGEDNQTSIYRRIQETDTWYLLSHADTCDRLLEQLAEAYQMLCSPRGRKLTERCYCTKDFARACGICGGIYATVLNLCYNTGNITTYTDYANCRAGGWGRSSDSRGRSAPQGPSPFWRRQCPGLW